MTRTMKMVSANKLRKSQELLRQVGVCAEEVRGMLSQMPPAAPAGEEWSRKVVTPRALVLLVTSDADLALPAPARGRLLARLGASGGRVTLELVPGDGAFLDRPGERERAWGRITRFARSAGTSTP